MQKILSDHLWILIPIIVWTLPWKAVALWRSARRGHIGWFLVLLITNTLAILDIIYIAFFSGGGDSIKPADDEPAQDIDMPNYSVRQRKFASASSISRGRGVIV